MEDYSKKNTIKKFLNIPKHYILMVKNSPKNKGFSRIFPLAQSKGYQYNKVKDKERDQKNGDSTRNKIYWRQ